MNAPSEDPADFQSVSIFEGSIGRDWAIGKDEASAPYQIAISALVRVVLHCRNNQQLLTVSEKKKRLFLSMRSLKRIGARLPAIREVVKSKRFYFEYIFNSL